MGTGSDTRERILQEALNIFARHGYEGARMEAIAARVGINKASLYFHFKSKEDIFRELFKSIVKNYRIKIKNLVTVTQGLPTHQRLNEIYQAYLEYSWDNTEMDFWNRVYYFPPELMREEIIQETVAKETAFQKDLAEVFAAGIQKKEIRSLDPMDMAKTFYYLLTCIAMSTEMMDISQGLRDMEACFNIFWGGVYL